MADRRSISIICPVYNEEASVPLFYDQLQAAIAPLRHRYDIELVFTNNRSTDGTEQAIRALNEADSEVQLLTLSRNCGYQQSIWAGLRHARGDAVIVIDVDCEDPPELLPEFVANWEKGYDIVYGRRNRRREPRLLTLCRKLFYRVNKLIADSDIVLDMAEFSLMSAAVRDAILSSNTTFPFIRAEIGHYGFSRYGIPYDRGPRNAGKTSYSLWGMIVFAVVGTLSSSTFPLRLPVYLLPFLVCANLALFIMDMMSGGTTGFRALVVIDLMFLACSASMIALYESRTYRNVAARAMAVVDRRRSILNRH